MNYKSTLVLPSTSFPMKARLGDLEKDMLAHWRDIDLSGARRTANKTRKTAFVLHDGPPYANGHIHMGHALNKILKDVINRIRFMEGMAVDYVPGWDCHGLPIEWKVEEDLRAGGTDKDTMPVDAFRARCRDEATRWMKIQSEEFQRLGIEANWDDPYATMKKKAEAAIIRILMDLLCRGHIVRGVRPVMWSVVEKTALAEAEIDYKPHRSKTVMAAFRVLSSPCVECVGSDVVIWTTTPWTLPGNRALACGAGFSYLLIAVDAVGGDSLLAPGRRLLIAEGRLDSSLSQMGVTAHTVVRRCLGRDLVKSLCRHPFAPPTDNKDAANGYHHPVPLLAADFVTLDTGTGFVHIAPGHGEEDFRLGRANDLELGGTVGEDGTYHADVPLFAGRNITAVTGAIFALLKDNGTLCGTGTLRHSYPHSWRSGAPLIFRVTPQWFLDLEASGIRAAALEWIDKIDWFPPTMRQRIRAHVSSRPDWCLSRQRSWGVPLAIFYDVENGEPLRDAGVAARVVEAFAKHGADGWLAGDPRRFLGPDHDPDRYRPVPDVLDVWFDSGASFSYVLEDRDTLRAPADLYLEGSDQHRGWFQSSLILSVAARSAPPYRQVLTHGFVLDEKGRKMSKSAGNVIAPQDVVAKSGADVLRLWVMLSDYGDDMRLGSQSLDFAVNAYRRLRNTLRFVLGNLPPDHGKMAPKPAELDVLEQWLLHELYQLDQLRRQCGKDYRLNLFYGRLLRFCTIDLSALYFDIRKDRLYCDSREKRAPCLWVMEKIFSCIVAWLAPVLSFTAEEAWMARQRDCMAPDDLAKEAKGTIQEKDRAKNRADVPLGRGSIHLTSFPSVSKDWHNPDAAAVMDAILRVREVVTAAIERMRESAALRSSLEGHADITLPRDLRSVIGDGVGDDELADIFLVSSLRLIPLNDEIKDDGIKNDGIKNDGGTDHAAKDDGAPGDHSITCVISKAAGDKCPRCWRIAPTVSSDKGDLCGRCHRVLAAGADMGRSDAGPS